MTPDELENHLRDIAKEVADKFRLTETELASYYVAAAKRLTVIWSAEETMACPT